jgi:hypothetical protein
VELDNLGFNLYRSATAAGPRVKLNAALIPGLGTSVGQAYEWMDLTAAADQSWYYWLEDVAWDGATEVHGPAVVRVVPTPGTALATFGTGGTGGLYRVSVATLRAAGLPVEALDPAALRLDVDGQQVPLYVSATGPVFGDEDYILFYTPTAADGGACTIGVDAAPLRMDLVYARPSRGAGAMWSGAADGAQRVDFATSTNYVRYLVNNFTEAPVWLMDVTAATNSHLMYGFTYLPATNGLTSVYLSYAPASGPAQCVAVGAAAVIDVQAVTPK